MIFTEGIQRTVGKAVLRRDYKKISRKRYTHNLNTAETVGILFAPSNKEELNIVKRFLGFLLKLEIKVSALAFLENKNHNIEPILERQIDFVDRKDFNWFHKPLTPVLKKFINKEFDILINLCIHNSLPINFIVSQSKAKLKAGRYKEDKETFCDLMIDIKQTEDISFLIDQVSHYLSVINNA